MKTFLVILALTFSVGAFADLRQTSSVLGLSEVVELDSALGAQGKKLFQVKDLHAENGIQPRCMCSSYELSYRSRNLRTTTVETYLIKTMGHGVGMNVTITQGITTITRDEVRD